MAIVTVITPATLAIKATTAPKVSLVATFENRSQLVPLSREMVNPFTGTSRETFGRPAALIAGATANISRYILITLRSRSLFLILVLGRVVSGRGLCFFFLQLFDFFLQSSNQCHGTIRRRSSLSDGSRVTTTTNKFQVFGIGLVHQVIIGDVGCGMLALVAVSAKRHFSMKALTVLYNEVAHSSKCREEDCS
jgi:hypothetical protein